VNSINYWRNPTMGLRRNVDIVYALYGLVYQSLIYPLFQDYILH